MKTLKAVAARYNATSLILRIVIGLVVGAVLALAVPGAGWVEEFGSLFVGALKGIAPVRWRRARPGWTGALARSSGCTCSPPSWPPPLRW